MSKIFMRLSRASVPTIRRVSPRAFSTLPALRRSSIPYTRTCPSPSCECAAAPVDLDIDRSTPLLNTMAAYSEQIILCTGQPDWHSKIEHEDGDTGTFVRGLKSVVGKGGVGFDVGRFEMPPFHNIVVTASSLPATTTPDSTTALLFPAFKRIPSIPHTTEAYNDLATAYLKARKLHPMHDGLNEQQKANLLRNESFSTELPQAEDITKPTIFICGHGGRDQRCGILGPILQSAFTHEMQKRGIDADVGVISHIGGHKFAGNVIIYLPPSMESNALKGTGIWYGRVMPENVEGVVDETIVKGRVIVDLLRGGITMDGANIGRMLEAQLANENGEDGGLKLRPRARR